MRNSVSVCHSVVTNESCNKNVPMNHKLWCALALCLPMQAWGQVPTFVTKPLCKPLPYTLASSCNDDLDRAEQVCWSRGDDKTFSDACAKINSAWKRAVQESQDRQKAADLKGVTEFAAGLP